MRRFDEQWNIVRFARQALGADGGAVLDVGCGYGRNLGLLKEVGKATGVDVNPRHVESVRKMGFEAFTPEQFEATGERYDLLLLSHVIEHFAPHELLNFMDGYLDRLHRGGHLIICTPTMWRRFYCNFDHVRPYPPKAIMTVFGDPDLQVQYHARNRLEMVDVALRKRPRGFPDPVTRTAMKMGGHRVHRAFGRLQSAACRVLYSLTGGACGGEVTGWVGLFRKIGP